MLTKETLKKILDENYADDFEVVFDVKSVDSSQDTARLSEVYSDDGTFVLVLH